MAQIIKLPYYLSHFIKKINFLTFTFLSWTFDMESPFCNIHVYRGVYLDSCCVELIFSNIHVLCIVYFDSCFVEFILVIFMYCVEYIATVVVLILK